MGSPSRRDVLKTLAIAGAATLLPSCSGGGPTGDIPAGNVSNLSAGSLQGVPGQSVIIGHDSGGLYAMTAICTHAGCDMDNPGSISSQGVYCGCHGSVFDAQGNVVQGPAQQPLTHFAVSVDATGAVTIHASNPVSASQRTPV